jgi:hypothetical protein
MIFCSNTKSVVSHLACPVLKSSCGRTRGIEERVGVRKGLEQEGPNCAVMHPRLQIE